MTKLEKQLLSLSFLGVTITFANGHRWIHYHEDIGDWETLLEMYNRIHNTDQGEYTLKCKIYGDVHEALNYIDSVLKELKEKSLLDMYNEYNDWFCE